MKRALDLNMNVAAALRDMAAVQTSRGRQRGYMLAANAIRDLDEALDQLVADPDAVLRIPQVGPSSARIIAEVMATGRSLTVEREVTASPLRHEVERRRSYRTNFLSRAMARAVLARTPPRFKRRGDLQMHSTWSDGVQTLDDIVAGCLARGYAYAAVTDHSAGLPIANGLSVTRLASQAKAIDAVNKRHAGRFRLLRGVEANILADGVIDVPPEVRARMDIVVAAPHSGLRSAAPQTARLIAAIRAPGVHILGHPRGRKYDARPGIAADWKAVFRAAAERGVAIELDGDPSRQDLDFELAAEALGHGCLFAIDSDAHAVDELAYADIAQAHALVAGIPADRIVNCWPLEKLLRWARSRQGPRRTSGQT